MPMAPSDKFHNNGANSLVDNGVVVGRLDVVNRCVGAGFGAAQLAADGRIEGPPSHRARSAVVREESPRPWRRWKM